MKKYIYILAAAAAFVGCAKEVTPTEETQNQQPETGVKTVTFTASIEGETKGTLDSKGKFTWIEDSDEVAVWTNLGKKMAVAKKVSGGSAEFTFTLGEGESIAEGAILVYPAYRLTAATTVDFTPKVFNTADAPAAEPILAAKLGSDRTELNFKYVCATAQVTITDVPKASGRIRFHLGGGNLGGNSVIGFTSEGVPSYTSSGSDNTTAFFTSWGSKTIIVPLEGTGDLTFGFDLKEGTDSNAEFFSKSTGLTVQRNSYFKMASLTINPEVYFVSDFVGWSTDANNVTMEKSGNDYSISLQSIGNQKFGIVVKYPSGYSVQMGPSTNELTTLENVSYIETTNKHKLSDWGAYTFTFNPVSGLMNVTQDATKPTLYFGLTSDGTNWVLDKSKELTWINDVWAYITPIFYGKSTVYYNPYAQSMLGGTNETLDGTELPSMGENNTYVLLINIPNSYYYLQYLGSANNDQNKDHMYIKGTFNDWAVQEMTRDANYKRVWTTTITVSDDNSEFGFCETAAGGNWWGNTLVNSGYYNTSGAENGSGSGNATIDSGTHFIILHDNSGNKVYIKL